ncbi:MAG: DUF2065 domain-containing protein [Desulfofustis sp.]|nr:DUF2065 domain-containing protein [Desulfofustis sp.]
MKLLILVFGLVLVVEGLPYATAPERMQEWMLRLSEVPPKTLRLIGFSSMGAGLLICWIVQNSGMFG